MLQAETNLLQPVAVLGALVSCAWHGSTHLRDFVLPSRDSALRCWDPGQIYMKEAQATQGLEERFCSQRADSTAHPDILR